ncbi:RNA-binding protein, putative [Bodo saltans]|uniref:RNA-binding protein, putative n=1 Tax=Bodo saltans TaxID=75058 RepID=A0A0S4JP51_BODSA|nr:RNA-binding protein, putative [Bodo saltans]|eukprot:CUG93326.1 RNA-binding protein, putative [Bodo saltans]
MYQKLNATARPWQPGAGGGGAGLYSGGQQMNAPAMFGGAFPRGQPHGGAYQPYGGGGGGAQHHSQQQQQQQPRAKISKTAAKLFVGQLPFECDEQRLRELFGAYGSVEQVHILKDSENRSKGAAFITYSNVEEADTAIFTLHNRYRMLTNRAIQVSYAKNSPNISPFGSYNAMEVATLNPSNPVPDVAVTSQVASNQF